MDLNLRKAEFSIAYTHAIAATAGYALEIVRVDMNSVDVSLVAKEHDSDDVYPRLDLQLKCTARSRSVQQIVHFPLKMKNYNDLRRTKVMYPRILLVLEVPSAVTQWISHGADACTLRHHAYWFSLRGMTDQPNVANVTIQIPRTQQFTVQELQAIMNRISQGGLP